MCNTKIAFALVLALCIGLTLCSTTNAQVRKATPSSPLPGKTVTTVSNQNCAGDTASPSVAPGWNLQWQSTFEHPIARPPIVSGSQILLIERADPTATALKDTIVVLDPLTGLTQWQFAGITDTLSYSVRKITHIYSSTKYWFVIVQYVGDGLSNSFDNELVLERQSAHIVYNNRVALSGGWMTIISDEAVYDDNGYGYMRRFNLPTGTLRWELPWANTNGARGLFPAGSWLYYFNHNGNVYRYDPLSGQRVATASLGLSPQQRDMQIVGQLALMRSWDNKVGAFDLESMAPRWITEVSDRPDPGSNAFLQNEPTISSIAYTPTALYVFDANYNLLRLDLATGHVTWRTRVEGVQPMSRPAVAQGLVYGFFSDGTLRAFSESNGQAVWVVMQVPLWYLPHGKSGEFLDLYGGLSVAGDTVIVTTGCRSVYAIQHDK